MNAQELLEKVPEPLRPAVAKYAPALAAMSAEEIWAWIELLVKGRTREAMDSLAARLADDELLDAMHANEQAWLAANRENASRLALQREASLAVLKALLTAALALVGL
jgi:cytochrome c553